MESSRKRRNVSRIVVGIFAMCAAALWGQNTHVHSPISLGIDKSLGGLQLLPQDDAWNRDISADSVDPNSERLIASIGLNKPLHPDFGAAYHGVPNGIPYVVVGANQPRVRIEPEYKDESDPGPFPIPPDAPIEGGPNGTGDRHVLVIDRSASVLYELFAAFPQKDGAWKVGSSAKWDLKKVSYGQRPNGWTSCDAAGLPILPGLVRYDEVVERKEILHALRFTIVKSRHAYVPPATHFASPHRDENLPPMGMRVRLKADFDTTGFPRNCQVILQALKKYGMIVADNGSDWFLSGAPDPRWNDDELHALTRVKGTDFEVVKMGEMTTR